MRYLVTLKPLEPFMFGGDQTFGALGDKEAGSYLVKSRQFPQQTALLGMLKKEMMTQAGFLTRKRRGEWVDKQQKKNTVQLVGEEKFSMLAQEVQNFGAIKNISPIFLKQKEKRYIKKVDIDSYPYVDGKLEGYDPKKDIYDNFVSLDGAEKLSAEKIFKAVEQTANKKGGEENSLFKKTSYMFINDFVFAFYVDVDFALESSIVTLGADRSAFSMKVEVAQDALEYVDVNGYLILLSDAYITVDIRDNNATFAISSEISHRNLTHKKTVRAYDKIQQKHPQEDYRFSKSETLYLYEKGSVFINPSDTLMENLNNKNLQQIGYNIYTQGEK